MGGGPTVVRFHGFTLDAARRLSDGDAIHIGAAVFVFRVTNSMASMETAANSAPKWR